MKKKIDLELFRFCVERDYLPYFAKLRVDIDEEKTLSDLLEIVLKNFNDYAYCAYGFKINGVVVCDFELKIASLYKRFGKEWKIEPLNTHLATQDLTINTEFFMKKIEKLKEFGFDEDEDFILSFLPLAYATPLAVENEDYLSEAFFVLALRLYKMSGKFDILDYVCENGVLNAQNTATYFYPQALQYDESIAELKALVFKHNPKLQQQIQKNL